MLVYSNSPKAFCAGGDVRAARDGVLAEKWAEVDEFFEGEYALNGDIAEYPKPYIAVIDGVAMGGGLGISAHGSHRVVTEKAFASMPEMAIGYVTDVGIAYMSQRMVGTRGEADPALAKFWGLSGYRMYAADMLWSGLATHVVNDADAFIEDVIADGVDAAIEKHAVEPEGQPELAGLIQDIDEVFQHATWEEIAAALPQHPELAELFAKLTEKACASALVAATELSKPKPMPPDIREALRMELELGKHMLRRPDFAEGVRAVLVDKTKTRSSSRLASRKNSVQLSPALRKPKTRRAHTSAGRVLEITKGCRGLPHKQSERGRHRIASAVLPPVLHR